MADATRKPPLVTVSFTDITGSTALYTQHGDAAAFALTSRCLTIVDAQICATNGRVVKRLGDSVLSLFDTGEQALVAAARIRSAIADPANGLSSEGIHARTGIACGEAVTTPDDVFGDVVNVAARIVSLAGADEIFLTGKVYDALPRHLRQQTRLIDRLPLRNRPTPVVVYEFLPAEADLAVNLPVRICTSAAAMEITHGELLFVVGPERPHVTIGRNAENDICINHVVVSRSHAEIAMRGDKFVLIDRSTNGTSVYIDSGPMLRVVREELVLSGNGRIVPGREGKAPIRFRLALP